MSAEHRKTYQRSHPFAEHVSKNAFAYFRWACLVREKYRRIWGEIT